MFAKTQAYSGFAVDDFEKAREFYDETLGIEVEVLSAAEGLMSLKLMGGERPTFVYAKDDVEPANYTILNFDVEDVDQAVDALAAKGIEFERYEGFDQDEKGISRGLESGQGPSIAWFKDPAGNILAVMQSPG